MSERTAVVIGTGAGGLAAAGYLARGGFRVIALEQSGTLGGNLAPFERDGFVFDTGLHYVGQCRPGQLMHGVLAGLGIDAEKLFAEVEPEGFDIYRFPDFEVRNCRGLDAFRDRLRRRFPAEDYGLLEVFALIRAAHGLQALGARGLRMEDLGLLPELPGLLRFGAGSFGALLHHWIEDPRVRAVLAAHCGDYALPPERASALEAMGVLAHYADGAFYPRGGSGVLRDVLVAAAREHGAEVRSRARVRAIKLRGGRVAGVELEDGEALPADVVVSDVDPTVTFGKLLPREALPLRLRQKVDRTVPSLGAFVVHLGLRRDLAQRGFSAANLWSYPSVDIDAVYAPLLRGELPDELPLFATSNSLKDEWGRQAPPGCSTLVVMTFVPESTFARWAELAPDARPEEYTALKVRLADRVLAQLERAAPGLVGDVAVREISTPLTWAHHLGAPHGAAYGPALTPRQAGLWRFSTRTPVGGLLLAGQGVLGNGVALSLLSGKLAAVMAERSAAHT